MTELFGPEFAAAYDALYQDKNYAEECRLIDRLLQSYSDGTVRRVIDLGCGTGNHVVPLAEIGYELAGVDRSEQMLEAARHKASDQRLNCRTAFYQGDIRSFHIEQSFDASLMMFAVLGYQLENRDVLAALRTARRHLKPGGILIFDVWYGPAVLQQGPSERVKAIPTEHGEILRWASGRLDVQRHLCEVSYRLWRIEDGRARQAQETHRMRFFFAQELNLFMQSADLMPLRLGAFPEFDRNPDSTTWNVCGIARAA